MTSIFDWVERDPLSHWMGTGYYSFHSNLGIDGLGSEVDGQLDLLAVMALEQRKGHFRDFINKAKTLYRTIVIREVWNEELEAALKRYGFVYTIETVRGEVLHSYRWTKP